MPAFMAGAVCIELGMLSQKALSASHVNLSCMEAIRHQYNYNAGR